MRLCSFANMQMCGLLKLFFITCSGKKSNTFGVLGVSPRSISNFIFRCLFLGIREFSLLAYKVYDLPIAAILQ